MCVIWPEPDEVQSTQIFARNDGVDQFLAYQMEIDASQPVAMILPIPVALPARDAMRIIL